MRKTAAVFIIIILIFMTHSALAQMVKAKHAVELEDPVGDVRDQGDEPSMDVVKVSITSDGKNIQVIAVLKETISYYLEEHKADEVISLHFDIDKNAETGGLAFWGKKAGFEHKVSLVACIQYENGGLACMGSVGGKITGYISSLSTYAYEQGKKSPKRNRSSLESTQKAITDKEIEIEFPYRDIGVSSGQSIRMVIRESDSFFNDESYFPEVLFTLK